MLLNLPIQIEAAVGFLTDNGDFIAAIVFNWNIDETGGVVGKRLF